MAASKGVDDAVQGGGKMQLTSSGFSLSQVFSAERMRMIQKGDEVCTLLDEIGQPVGTVLLSVGALHLGPNEETVFLRRDN